MNLQTWQRRLLGGALAAFVLQLAACGAGDGGGGQGESAGVQAVPERGVTTLGAPADASSTELIDAALMNGEIDAETALTFKVFAMFRDARLPVRYRGSPGDEPEVDALDDASAAFASLSGATQQALAPFLRRPADLGSWASPATAAIVSGHALGCMGPASRWAAVNPAGGGKVKVWYDTAVAGDRATALAVLNVIDSQAWPARMEGGGGGPVPNDASPAGCDGGDDRLDVYLVRGVQARGLAVSVPGSGAGSSSVFVLVNAEGASDTAANAALGVVGAVGQARWVAAASAAGSGRKRASAVTGDGSGAAPAAAVVQMKSVPLSSAAVTVALDRPVAAGNWLAVAVSALGASPANVALSDNHAHQNQQFASAGLRYGSSFGTVWRYVKLTGAGAYTLNVNRGAATSGSVQVLELANVDANAFLDIAAVGSGGTGSVASATFKASTTTNDLLLSVVAVRSGSASLSPAGPTGSVMVEAPIQSDKSTAGVLAVNTTALGSYRMAASLAVAGTWRMSSVAVRGAKGAPVVAAPVNTAPPVVTVSDNSASLGLATSQGTWANSPTAHTYGWARNGALIPGATLASYTTTVADQGSSVAAVVTASNSAGAASATSAAVPVPVPSSPTAPSVALTASPQSVTQGQPSMLAWSATNATSCTASGAWSGAKAMNGSVAVTPAATSSYSLECVGAGGLASAAVDVAVTAAPVGSAPTLGAHGLVFHISKGSVAPTLSVPAMSTQSGSTLLAFVGKGSVWNLSLPFDNKGNQPYAQIGPIHEYKNWPGEGTAMYAFNSIVGGANHLVSIDDSNVWDEVTFAVVEVRNGGVIQDYKWNEVLKPNALTSQSVTTTGPATLIAVWYGDDSSSTPSNPVPNNGFTVIEGNGNATESVQMFVATKDVVAAGTYNVTWNPTPVQGAQLYLIAVQKR